MTLVKNQFRHIVVLCSKSSTKLSIWFEKAKLDIAPLKALSCSSLYGPAILLIELSKG